MTSPPTKPPIDEAMIERAYQRSFDLSYCSSPRAFCRAIVEAALTVPPEPEIPVSDAMWCAGGAALLKHCPFDPKTDRHVVNTGTPTIAHDVYRAMELQRRKEEGQEARLRPLEDEHLVWVKGRPQIDRRGRHRRKTDPT